MTKDQEPMTKRETGRAAVDGCLLWLTFVDDGLELRRVRSESIRLDPTSLVGGGGVEVAESWAHHTECDGYFAGAWSRGCEMAGVGLGQVDQGQSRLVFTGDLETRRAGKVDPSESSQIQPDFLRGRIENRYRSEI